MSKGRFSFSILTLMLLALLAACADEPPAATPGEIAATEDSATEAGPDDAANAEKDDAGDGTVYRDDFEDGDVDARVVIEDARVVIEDPVENGDQGQ